MWSILQLLKCFCDGWRNRASLFSPEPNLSSLGWWPVLRWATITSFQMKLGNVGLLVKMQQTSQGGEKKHPFLIIHCSPNLTFTPSCRCNWKTLGCVWASCGCCLGSESRSCLWGVPGRGNNGSDPLLCVVALLNQTIQRSDWILILLVPP